MKMKRNTQSTCSHFLFFLCQPV